MLYYLSNMLFSIQPHFVSDIYLSNMLISFVKKTFLEIVKGYLLLISFVKKTFLEIVKRYLFSIQLHFVSDIYLSNMLISFVKKTYIFIMFLMTRIYLIFCSSHNANNLFIFLVEKCWKTLRFYSHCLMCMLWVISIPWPKKSKILILLSVL